MGLDCIVLVNLSSEHRIQNVYCVHPTEDIANHVFTKVNRYDGLMLTSLGILQTRNILSSIQIEMYASSR